MKNTALTICLFFLAFTAQSQQIAPSAKVLAAFTTAELNEKTQAEIIDLNIIADHLCWFEDIKPANDSEIFQLTDKQGNAVTLTESELLTFNPLLYQLPQQDFICGNLVIVTAEGQKHLLVVRSVSMMQTKIERVKKQMAK